MRSSMWFQHDGAPTHYNIDVHLQLNATYGQQWFGRGGTVLCPARSPDRTCLDYFLWCTSSNWCTKLPLTVLRTLLHASRQLLGKSGTRPVFSPTFDLQCPGDVRPVSRQGDVILNTYFDDNRCLFSFLQFFAVLLVINMFSPLIHTLSFLCFVSSLPRQESRPISDHALLCDFPSSRCTLSDLKVCNRCTETPCIPYLLMFEKNWSSLL
ncbi:hypothetical protein AVEN_224855-1 [Araneus ventricosus]|uniref:Uncharacterized protein n=1 Tax=Araneus ventricosus TaxID=182803 RepID=A0A4Y1ZUB6_ARAVE|nr:hypothetical protein AVEN_224855-1 [Araneus ventricosus]